MTAYGTTQTTIEAMKLGAYDYLLKPFDVPKLKEIVFNALKAARDMRQVVSYQPLLEKEITNWGSWAQRADAAGLQADWPARRLGRPTATSSPARAARARNSSRAPSIIIATAVSGPSSP